MSQTGKKAIFMHPSRVSVKARLTRRVQSVGALGRWVLSEGSMPQCWNHTGRAYSNYHCVTQLKLYTLYKLSSSIFCCLSVRHQCHPINSPLFPIYTGKQDLCWPCTTQYQTVPTYTDQVPARIVIYLPSTIRYHLFIIHHLKAQFSQLNNFSFYNSFDKSRTVHLV